MLLWRLASLVYTLTIVSSHVKAATSLPSDTLRRQVLDILTDLSGQHTAQCTRNAQPLYKEQVLDRYKILYGHKSKDEVASQKLLALPKHTYFFALNLYNSFDILPDLLSNAIKVASLLGLHNVYISIYENGSSDQTKAVLHLVEILAKAIGLRMTIRISSRSRSAFSHRIEYLAEVRNAALAPLYDLRTATGETFDTVVFMNDVLPCVDDILELIWQSRHNNAGITCAADYVFLDKVNSPVFYDNWVSRDMNGTALNNEPFHDVVLEPSGQERFTRHLPLQLYSCWNGIAVIDPAPLYQVHTVRFRMADLKAGECSASECSLISKDYWASGYGRIMMVPRVKLTYDSKTYRLTHPPRRELGEIRKYVHVGGMERDLQDRQWFGPHDRLFHPAESEKIDFLGPPENVYCWGWDGAGFLTGPDAVPIWEESPISTKAPVKIWHDRGL